MMKTRLQNLLRLDIRAVLLAVLALLAMAASPCEAELLIEPGDTVHVTVADASRFDGDRRVDVDGRIMMPQLGGIVLKGLRLDQAGDRIAEQLVERDILRAPNVLVEMTKYRPVYIGGKVRRPGSIDFEPGMTVRHALILAGGAGQDQEKNAASVDIPELRSKWKTASYQLLQVDSRIARLEAELARRETTASPAMAGSVPAPDREALASLDGNILKDRLQSWTENQVHLRDALALYDLEIDVLGQQAGLQKNERDLTGRQVETARGLVEKGLMPLPRLQELEHVQSQASQDLLENQAFMARARQSRATIEYELKTADINWRMEISQQIREALTDRTRLKADLEALSSQILNAGDDLAEATDRQFQTVIEIYRSEGTRRTPIVATMDTEIMPGDVLDVSFSKGSG